MNWSEQYPNYHERMVVMEESCYYWLKYWEYEPETEPTILPVHRTIPADE